MTQAHCYAAYINDIQLACSTHPRKFWAYSKSNRQNNSFHVTMKFGSSSSSNPEEICEFFKSTFTNIPNSSYLAHSSSLPSDRRSHPRSETIPIPSWDMPTIKNVLLSLDEKKNGGPDGLPNIFPIKTADALAKPLTTLFNMPIQTGTLPECWKLAFITPIFEKGCKTQVEHYRPITILNALAKVFEKLVFRHIAPFITPLLLAQQHGFMPNRSTVTN